MSQQQQGIEIDGGMGKGLHTGTGGFLYILSSKG